MELDEDRGAVTSLQTPSRANGARQGLSGRRRNLLAVSTGLIAASGMAAAVLAVTPNERTPPAADQGAPSKNVRTIALGPETAALLQHSFPQSTAAYDPGTLGLVLASTDTARGEMVLLGVELPDGKQCVVQRYATLIPGGASGSRCGTSREALFDGPIDVAASEELNPTGDNVSVVWGVLPPGSVRAKLTGDPGRVQTAEAYDGGAKWERRSFFILESPVLAAEVVQAVGDGGEKKGEVRKRFRPA